MNKDDRTKALRKSLTGETGDTGETGEAGEAAKAAETAQATGASEAADGGEDSGQGSGIHPFGTQRQPVSRRFGRYELLMELASGGMATLYLARLRGPQQFEKLVAIKIIHTHLTKEPKFIKMFFDEARIAALVHHPNVVQIFDLGDVDASYFIAMEYIHGYDLREVLRTVAKQMRAARGRPPRYDWYYPARIAAEAAAGLHAAHELRSSEGEPLGLVHRDVSPHNILISYDGHVKLTDFGIAYAKHRLSHTDSGVVKGKLAYMSPEHAHGEKVDRRADIFSLGIVLWEAVCMKRLFRRQTDTATLIQVTSAEVPPPRKIVPNLPKALEAIILRALARNPTDRYQNAQQLHQALEHLIAQYGVVVGATELSAMMHDLFRNEKAELDDQIGRAMKDSSELAVQPAKAEGTAETKLSAQAHSAIAAPRRRSRVLGGVLAVAVLLLLAVVYLVIRDQRRDKRSGASRKSASAGAVAMKHGMPTMDKTIPMMAATVMKIVPKPPSELLVKFVVKPARAQATIFFRGKQYRQNRLELVVAPGKSTEPVEIRAPGYYRITHHVTVRKEAKRVHEFRLRPVRFTMRPRPPPPMDMGYRPVDIGLDD